MADDSIEFGSETAGLCAKVMRFLVPITATYDRFSLRKIVMGGT